MKFFILAQSLFFCLSLFAQMYEASEFDFKLGSDIFTDFTEDIEAKKIMEDEHFWAHSRYFSMDFSIGLTTFDGNRGGAYEDRHPSFNGALNLFLKSNMSFGIGLAFSSHFMTINEPTVIYPEDVGIGRVENNLFRIYISYRIYFDTSNLGTAITFANPYVVGHLGYWLSSIKFVDHEEIGKQKDGALGAGVGAGLEFPLEYKEFYLGVETLIHFVQFPDQYSQMFRPVYNNFSGNTYTAMLSLNQSW